jgi:O-antigen/teichoic acid export membrane protein
MNGREGDAEDDSVEKARRLGRETVHAAAWNYLSFGLSKLTVIVTITILARLLGPGEFGVVGFATLVISYLSFLQDLGLGHALIQRRTDIDEASETVFTSNLAVGIALTLIVYLIAPYVADFFREPRVVPLLRILGLSFFIEAIGSTHLALLRRELDFRRKVIPDLGRALLKGIVSIGLAFLGYGVWSLVVGQLAGAVTGVCLAWITCRWRPRFHINTALLRSMLGFSSSIIGVDVIGAIGSNLGYTLVGRLLGDAALGLYTMAFRIPELAIDSIWTVLAQVLFPTYANVQHDMRLLAKGFLATIRYLQLVIVPISLMIILVTDPLVRALLGPEWIETIPVMRLIAVSSLIISIGSNVGDVYKAIGRANILWKLGIYNLLAVTLCLVIGVRYGLLGVAIGRIVAAIYIVTVRLFYATRVLDISLLDMARQMRPAFNGGVALCLVVLPLLASTAGMNQLLQLILACLCGGLAYLGALWLFEKDAVIIVLEMLGLRKALSRM